LLVVREGVTERADAEDAVQLLRKLKAPLLGAVLNDAQGSEVREADRIADLLAGIDVHEHGTAPAEPVADGCRVCEVTRNGNRD
jgi:Mrp family chromosome partitioning ATPase